MRQIELNDQEITLIDELETIDPPDFSNAETQTERIEEFSYSEKRKPHNRKGSDYNNEFTAKLGYHSRNSSQ